MDWQYLNLKKTFAILFISLVSQVAIATTPCGSFSDLLLFIDRPSAGDSACVVPEKQTVLESGYTYEGLLGGGTQQSFPAAFLRFGLANRFEWNIYLSNYINQSVYPYTGSDPVYIGLKHEIGATERWVAAIEGYIVPASGSPNFGTQAPGGLFNGIFSYNLSSEISLSGMLGVSSQTQPIVNGGGRYFSVNPDLVLSWSKEKLSLYAEVYGQSKTALQEGSGFNMDLGLVYLIKKNVAVDAELGQRISGVLFGFNHYVGMGISVQFG